MGLFSFLNIISYSDFNFSRDEGGNIIDESSKIHNAWDGQGSNTGMYAHTYKSLIWHAKLLHEIGGYSMLKGQILRSQFSQIGPILHSGKSNYFFFITKVLILERTVLLHNLGREIGFHNSSFKFDAKIIKTLCS